MSNYCLNPSEQVLPCPYCGAPCEADWVDVEVAFVQCGPFHCQQCRASEIGPNDAPRELSEAERKTGWYAPGEPYGSSANTVGGLLVDHDTAKLAHEMGVLDIKPTRLDLEAQDAPIF